jgi:hypothetical protein
MGDGDCTCTTNVEVQRQKRRVGIDSNMKARQWLATQPLEGHSIDDLIQLAVKLLSSA